MLLPLNDIGMIRNTLACLVAEAGVADVPVRLRQGPPYQAMPLAGIRRGRNEWRRGQRDGGLTSKPGHRLHQFTRPTGATAAL